MINIIWIFIFAIIITILIYFIIKYIAERNQEFDFDRFRTLFKIYLYIMLIIMIILLFIFKVIILQITLSDETNSYLYTLMVGITLGIFMNDLGIANKGIKNKKLKYAVLVLLIVIYVIVASYYDFLFIFNIDFLIYKKISFSSAEGIWFLWFNFWIMTILFILSFSIESEHTE